jgi:hypothetical protein
VITLLAAPAALAAWHWSSIRTPLLMGASWSTMFGLSLPLIAWYATRHARSTLGAGSRLMSAKSRHRVLPVPRCNAVPDTGAALVKSARLPERTR